MNVYFIIHNLKKYKSKSHDEVALVAPFYYKCLNFVKLVGNKLDFSKNKIL